MILTGATTHDLRGATHRNILINTSGTASVNAAKDLGTTPLKIGAGTFDAGENITCGNLTVATGATYTANDDTLTVAGDFTTSGGLLGTSCLTLNGTNEYASTVSAVAVGTNSAWTIEGWMKRTTSTGNEVFVELKNDSHNNNRVFFNIDTDDVQMLIYSNSGSQAVVATANQGLNDDKWHHVACTYDSTTAKIYIDGKLITSEVISKTMDNTDDRVINIGANVGTYANGFTGSIDEVRIWDDVRDVDEIRDNMFKEVSSGNGLVQNWRFNEGSGDTASANVGTSLNARVGGNSASSQSASLWATAGTFDISSGPTLIMAGTTQTITMPHAGDVYNLVVNDGSTTQINTLGTTSGLLDITNNLTVNEKLKPHSDTADAFIRFTSAGKTLTVGSDVKTTALAELHSIFFDFSGSMNIPELTAARLKGETNSNATIVATGDLTVTTELEVNNTTTFNANGNTINCYILDMKTGGTIDLRNSTLKATASAGRTFQFLDSTLLSGNSIIQGFDSTKPVDLFCTKDGNHELVGTLQDCEVQDDGDITVIGSVIRCTFDEPRSNIRQFFHTLDTQQLLDADEAGDDDLRLEKPALDNANELQTG